MEDDSTCAELQVMFREYEWLLSDEVKKVLSDLRTLLRDGLKNFNFHLDQTTEHQVKPEKFILSCPNGIHQSKCMVTLVGDLISEADLGVRLQKQPVIIYQTRIYPEMPWRLQQIQDAGNHLQSALSSIDSESLVPSSFTSGVQVLTFLNNLIRHLKVGRECLSLPKVQTIDDLMKTSVLKAFKPPLPQDTVATFFVQAQKLILAVYHLTSNSQNKSEIASRYQLECSIPWLNDTLLLFTIVLHKCQQLKDKVAMFVNYEAKLNRHRAGCQNLSEFRDQRETVSLLQHNSSIGSDRLPSKDALVLEANSSEVTCL